MHRLCLACAAWLLTISVTRAGFVNGDFSNGLNGWTVQYAFVTGNCDRTYTGWSASPVNSSQAAATTDTTDGLGGPVCSGPMAVLNNALTGLHPRVATRLYQEIFLTAADLGNSPCHSARVRAQWSVLLANGGSKVHSTNMLSLTHFHIEVRHKGNLVYEELITPNHPFPPVWSNPTGPYYGRRGTSECLVRNANVGDKVSIEFIAGDCCLTDHDGSGYVDCVEIVPTTDCFSSPTTWSSVPRPANGWFVGDYNGDGWADLAQWVTSQDVMVSSGSSFASLSTWSNQALGSSFPARGDFTGGGRADLLKYDSLSNVTRVFPSIYTSFDSFDTNQPAWFGQLGVYGFILTPKFYPGDYNGDGFVDLLAPSLFGTGQVFRSTGSSLLPAQTWTTEPYGYSGWYVGDFNGDGKRDLGRWTGSRFDVLLSTGTSFSSPTPWTTYAPGFDGLWFIGDYNCDGKDDLLRDYVRISTVHAEVLLSTGSSFKSPTIWTDPLVGPLKSRLYIGDYDGSGAEDIAHWPSNGEVHKACAECPCGLFVSHGVQCDPNDATKYIWKVSVTNRSAVPVASIQITSDPTVSICCNPTPNPPLASRYTTNLVLNVQVLIASSNHCGEFKLFDINNQLLCTIPFCFTTPSCACLVANFVSWTCTTDGSGDVFLNFTVTNKSGSSVTSILLDNPNPATATFTPSGFTISPLATGQTSAVLTTRISGGAPNLCFDVNLYAGVQKTCDTQWCLDVPDCPGLSGYCCVPLRGCLAVQGSLQCANAEGTFSTSSSICQQCGSDWPNKSGLLPVTPLGTAYAGVDPEEQLVIWNLGPAGPATPNGVDIYLVGVPQLDLEWYAIDPQGETPGTGALQISEIASAGPFGPLSGTLSLTAAGSGYDMGADFGPVAPLHRIEAYLGGVLVTSFSTTGSVGIATAWPVGLSLLRGGATGSSPGFALRWGESISLQLNGLPVSADELRVFADAPIAVSSFTHLSLTGADLPYMILRTAVFERLPCVDPSGQPALHPHASFDEDCDVDADDLVLFRACRTGPGRLYDSYNLPAGCTLTPDAGGHIPADMDADGDVDQDDFGRFQRCYSGSNLPADPNCGN